MKSSFVDSNIFLEVFARRGEKSDRSLALLQSAMSLWTTDLVVAEIEWVLRAGFELPRADITLCIKRILAFPSLAIDQKKELVEAIGLYEDSTADWIDCVNAILCKKKGIPQAITYDKHFDRFSWIKRIEP